MYYGYSVVQSNRNIKRKQNNRIRNNILKLLIKIVLIYTIISYGVNLISSNIEYRKTIDTLKTEKVQLVEIKEKELDEIKQESFSVIQENEDLKSKLQEAENSINELNSNLSDVKKRSEIKIADRGGKNVRTADGADVSDEFAYALKSKYAHSLSPEVLKHVLDMSYVTRNDPHFILAIIEQESNFNSNCVNPKSGATGLGQFMYATAKEVYETDFSYGKYTSHEIAKNPMINVEMMCTYISKLKSQYNNNYYKVLNAYSGGGVDWYYNGVNSKMKANCGYGISELK